MCILKYVYLKDSKRAFSISGVIHFYFDKSSWRATNLVKSIFLATKFLFQSTEKVRGHQRESWESKKKWMKII